MQIMMLAENARPAFSPFVIHKFLLLVKIMKKKDETKKDFSSRVQCLHKPCLSTPHCSSLGSSCIPRALLGHKGPTAYSYMGQLTSYIIR